MDVVKEDMAEVEVTEEDTEDRNNWKWKIRCGDPWWEKPKKEEERRADSTGKVRIVASALCNIVILSDL